MYTTIRNKDHEALKAEAEKFNQPVSDFVAILLRHWLTAPERKQWEQIRLYAEAQRQASSAA